MFQKNLTPVQNSAAARLQRLPTQRHSLAPPAQILSISPRHASRLPQTQKGAAVPKIDCRVHQKNNFQSRRAPAPPSTKETSIFWNKLLGTLGKGMALFAIAAAVGLAAAFPAEAARSGGRMGGGSFSRGPSYSRASSFGGGLSSSSSFGSRGLAGSAVSSRPSVSTSAFFFSPFGMGYGYGYPMGGGGGGLLSLLFWGVFAVTMVQVVRGVLNSSSAAEDDGGYSREVLSVAKVQVGLLSTARELQQDLERIASRADTTTPRGLHFVLQETVLALLRNPDYCVYGFAKSGIENSADQAEARFNKLSLEERSKFEKETRVNVAGRTSLGSLGRGTDLSAPVSELLVITILVAAEGRVKLPKVSSRLDLIQALTTLGAVPAADVLAVEVLWTPEEETDYFTQEDLSSDYPLLNTL